MVTCNTTLVDSASTSVDVFLKERGEEGEEDEEDLLSTCRVVIYTPVSNLYTTQSMKRRSGNP